VTVRTVAAAVFAVLVLAGCGGIAPDRVGAEQAARDFHTALAEGSSARACGLLAPRTLQELEDSTGKSCGTVVDKQGIPRAQEPETVDVYGNNARVVLRGDIVFLSQFGSGWKVVAAGCEPRHDRPYNCIVKGG
jgi:hypothetical protein